MASLRQIAANQSNAKLSTGPYTDEGKEASRRNALKHGLAGDGVVLPDEQAEAVSARMGQWRDAYRPGTDEEEWLFQQAVVNSVRVDHCQRLEVELRTYEARRALLSWDDDRRLDAEETAASLTRRPALVARRLRQTRQGCEWLLERWLALGAIAQANGGWTEAQQSLALDLLGTPADLRDAVSLGAPEALARREADDLERLCAVALDDLDDAARESAEVGLSPTTSADLNRLRRYEASCYRRYHDARRRLRNGSGSGSGVGSSVPVPVAAPAPAPPPPLPSPAPAPAPVREAGTDDDWLTVESPNCREILGRPASRLAVTVGTVSRETPSPSRCVTGGLLRASK